MKIISKEFCYFLRLIFHEFTQKKITFFLGHFLLSKLELKIALCVNWTFRIDGIMQWRAQELVQILMNIFTNYWKKHFFFKIRERVNSWNCTVSSSHKFLIFLENPDFRKNFIPLFYGMQICHKSFFYEIQIKIPSEIKPGENYMRVIRLVEGCHQLSWLSDSIRAQNERGILDIRDVGGQRGRLTPTVLNTVEHGRKIKKFKLLLQHFREEKQ